VEQRKLWSQAVDGATLGLAGAVQIFRLDQQVDYLRRGQVIKTTGETRYGVLSLSPEEAPPDAVLALVRDYWGIEIRQHYRRDHTQREDHCQVRHPVAAQNLSLMRSLAVVFGTWFEWVGAGVCHGIDATLSPVCHWTPESRCGLLVAWSLLLTAPNRRSVKISFTTGNCSSNSNVTSRLVCPAPGRPPPPITC
jgi:hypothetical protein